ncbi:MAG: hypothetical protein AMJ60_10250 [Desulfobacterales bacterium SG8_35]|nr:MAG: hypothetical protein AMJ60_10250 [Desulfobacterales bacterium SG8_35]
MNLGEKIMDSIIGKWRATGDITCKNQVQIKIGEEFDVVQKFENNNVKVLKGKYIGILDVEILSRSARKK